MKLAVIGSRSFNNYSLLENKLNLYSGVDEIISGGANGADKLAEKYARKYNIRVVVLRPAWNKYGNRAGLIRNKDIIGMCDEAIAFWDGKSPGTKNSIELCTTLNKTCRIVLF